MSESKTRSYEIILLLRHTASVDDIKIFFEQLKWISSENGKSYISAYEYWGLRKLEYIIRKSKSAHYYRFELNFADHNVLDSIVKKISISSDLVIRHLILNLENKNNIRNTFNMSKIDSSNPDVFFDQKFKDVLVL